MARAHIKAGAGEDLDDWSFQSRRYRRLEDALRDEFPNTLEANPILQHAVHQIEAARITINALMGGED